MIDHLAAIGPEIAHYMPGWGYVCEEDGWGSYLVPGNQKRQPNDLAIHLGVDTYKKRINVSGSWPKGQSPRDLWVDNKQQESPSISCGLDRDPKKIAADILRRFLPAYTEMYLKLAERAADQLTATGLQNAAAKEFAEIMGTTTNNDKASWFRDECYGSVSVNWGGDTATLELRGNSNVLKAALVAAFKEMNK